MLTNASTTINAMLLPTTLVFSAEQSVRYVCLYLSVFGQ